jgi:phage shock protein A
MAQSIFQKVQTLISANTHGIIDQVLSNNSISVFDQYIRQAERDLNELEEALITVKAQVKTLKRKYESYQQEADVLDQQIDELIESGKNDLALMAQSEYNDKFDLAQEYRKQYSQQKKEADKLAEARLKLEARLRSIRHEREHIIGLLELAKTKEIAAKSMKSLDALEGVGDADIANIADKIRMRLDRADAEVEMRAERLGNQMDDALGKDRLDKQLEERRHRLALRKAKEQEVDEDTANEVSFDK